MDKDASRRTRAAVEEQRTYNLELTRSVSTPSSGSRLEDSERNEASFDSPPPSISLWQKPRLIPLL